MKESTEPNAYRVNAVSPGRFSCGITLSQMKRVFAPVHRLTRREIVPKHGPKNGSQYLKISRSGFLRAMAFAAVYHVKGLMESINCSAGTTVPPPPCSSWLFPGKRNAGYS